MIANPLALPQLSLSERDRRWSAVRERMSELALDSLVIWGWPLQYDFKLANARYLCPIGGNAEYNVVVFPAHSEPTSFVFMPTFIDGWIRAQNWVADVRARKQSWAETVVMRIKELGLERGRVGIDGLATPLDPDGWLPHSIHSKLIELLPDVEFVNVGDFFESLRSIKSSEELGLLARAADLGDRMMEACAVHARPGVRECQVYARMTEAMVANGGEEHTLFFWAAGANPPPHPFMLPQQRALELGDIIICEIHPKYAGYTTHIERTFCVGAANAQYRAIYDGCLAAYKTGLTNFGPGKSVSEAMYAVRATVEQRGLGICEVGIHGHGLASLEYPRFRLHALKADEAAIAIVGDRFEKGMVFAFNIDLVDPNYKNGKTGCCFAETIIITETGARRMHSYDMALQELAV